MKETTEIKVLRVGNKIVTGNHLNPYRVYSNTVNFTQEDMIITLCNSYLSPGPYRIVLDGIFPLNFTQLQITDREIILDNDIRLAFTPAQIYRQPRCFPAIEGKAKNDMIKGYLDEFMVHEWGSLLTIINGKTIELSTLDIELKKCLIAGLNDLWQDNYQAFTENIKGRGPGSTPAGDDFMIGYLLCLSWLIEAWQIDLRKQREIVYNSALGSDPLVNTFLSQAYEYLLDKDWAELLNSLAGNRINRIEDDFYQIDKIGDTSGEDMLSGFFVSYYWNNPKIEGARILESIGVKKAK